MARHTMRKSPIRRDSWWLLMALFLLTCAAPFVAQFFGWWDATAVQREAARALITGATEVLLGADVLREQRRWPISRRRLPGAMLAIVGLGVAIGIISIVAGVVVLLGAMLVLPIDALTIQLVLLVFFVIVTIARLWAGPERLVL